MAPFKTTTADNTVFLVLYFFKLTLEKLAERKREKLRERQRQRDYEWNEFFQQRMYMMKLPKQKQVLPSACVPVKLHAHNLEM